MSENNVSQSMRFEDLNITKLRKIALCNKLAQFNDLKQRKDIRKLIRKLNLTESDLDDIKRIKFDIEDELIELKEEYEEFINHIEKAFIEVNTELKKVRKIIEIIEKKKQSVEIMERKIDK